MHRCKGKSIGKERARAEVSKAEREEAQHVREELE